ncbi:MAG: hypothetical protein JWQ14_3694 [Adhaeribacter sp.]|nr:hypothetical protein [Adhaeribacter sp.]
MVIILEAEDSPLKWLKKTPITLSPTYFIMAPLWLNYELSILLTRVKTNRYRLFD